MTEPLRLSVAGLSIKVPLGPRAVVVRDHLKPFLSGETSAEDTDLTIDLSGIPERPELAALHSAEPRPPVVHGRSDEGFWFHRVGEYSFLGTDDFSRWQVWGPDGGAVALDYFHGRPWLMFPLWAYVSHHDGVFMHAAACVVGGRFVLLVGRSGVGKTTLGGLIHRAGHACLTDEYAMLSWRDGKVWAHATPWPGVQGETEALSGPLESVMVLGHAGENRLTRLNGGDGGKALLRNARLFFFDPETQLPTIDLLDRVARAVPVFRFDFVPDLTAVDFLLQNLP